MTKVQKRAEIERNIDCLIDSMEEWFKPTIQREKEINGGGGSGGRGYYSTIRNWRDSITKLLSEI